MGRMLKSHNLRNLLGNRKVKEGEHKAWVTWEALKVGPLGGRGRWGRKNIFCFEG